MFRRPPIPSLLDVASKKGKRASRLLSKPRADVQRLILSRIRGPREERHRSAATAKEDMGVQKTPRRSAHALALLCGMVLLAGCAAPCPFGPSYENLPSGYQWHAVKDPTTHDVTYYGLDPRSGWTVYVGPDGRFYRYPGNHRITPYDVAHRRWCAHDARSPGAESIMQELGRYFRSLVAHHDRLSAFTYLQRPRGYGWRPFVDSKTGTTAFYGINPRNGWTVYVGPDGIYYTFPHAPPIWPSDLGSVWDPKDVRTVTPHPLRR